MSRLSRRFLALFTVLALVALPATGAAAATPEGVGTASTHLDLLKVQVNGLPIVSDVLPGLELGSLLGYSSTDTNTERNERGAGEPFAIAQLLLAGQQEFTARSDGETRSGGQSAALPGGLGSLTVGTVEAVVEDGAARSVIDALNGTVGGVLGLDVTLPEAGAVTNANDALALAQNGVGISGLNLTLGDLLPADVLGALPLDAVLGLLNNLNLSSLELSSVVAELDGVLGQIDGVTNDLLALGTAAELRGAIATLTDTLGSTTEDALPQLKDQLGEDCQVVLLNLCDQLDTVDTLPQLQSLVDVEQLTVLLDTLDGLLDTLTGILAGIDLDGLLDGILNEDLLAIDDMVLGVRAVAGQDGDATALCSAEGVSVLGIAAPLSGCDALKDGLSGLPGTLTGLLGSLPIVGGTLDGVVSVGGLEIIEERGTDGAYETARAAITPLSLKVDLNNLDLGLGGIDAGLLGVVEGLTGELDLISGLLPGAQTQSFQKQSTSEAQAVPGAGDISAVTGALEGLLGGNLGAIELPSLEVAGPGLNGDAEYTAAAGPAPEPLSPEAPTPDSKLPRTGGGLGLAAALLLAAGGATWMLRGRRGALDSLGGGPTAG